MIGFFISNAPINVSSGGMLILSRTVESLRADKVPEADILVGARAALKSSVDETAERLRQSVTTPGAGQAMEYQQAQIEAFDALSRSGGQAPVEPGAYPMLAASIGIDIDPSTEQPATDVLGVARSVKAAFAGWLALGAAIRKARLAGKAAIDAAATVEAAVGAADAISWPPV